MLKRLFVDHPASVGETYLQHMVTSASFGFAMLRGACASFVHALVPGLCTKTGSGIVADLHRRMVTHRTRVPINCAPVKLVTIGDDPDQIADDTIPEPPGLGVSQPIPEARRVRFQV